MIAAPAVAARTANALTKPAQPYTAFEPEEGTDRAHREMAPAGGRTSRRLGDPPVSVACVDHADARQRERLSLVAHSCPGAFDQVEKELVELLRGRTFVAEPPCRQDPACLVLALPAPLEVPEEPVIDVLPHGEGYRP